MTRICFNCGPVNMKVYPDPADPTTKWCKACAEDAGFICKTHPYYKVREAPTGECQTCWRIWENHELIWGI